jgi:hypothetical protein
MTFAELRQLVSYWVDDINQTYFTPTQLNRFLNNAQREVQKLLVLAGQDYYVKCAVTTLVVNQREYVFPDDFYKVNRLEVITSGTAPNENTAVIKPITINQKDLVLDSTGTPFAYYMKRNRFVLLPAPDAALTLRMDYSYKVADMVLDTDLPDVPEPYHEFIAVLGAIDCFVKDTRDVSDIVIAKRDSYLDMLKRDAAQRNIDFPRVIKYTASYEDVGEFCW